METGNNNFTASDSEPPEVECIDEKEHLLRERILRGNSPKTISVEDDITLQKILTIIETPSAGKHITH